MFLGSFEKYLQIIDPIRRLEIKPRPVMCLSHYYTKHPVEMIALS